MTFERSFSLTIYLLLFSGFAALLTSEAVNAWLALLYLGAILGSWASDEIKISGWWTQVALAAGLLAVFLIDVVAISGLIQSSVHLLMLISLLKLYTPKQDRDYLLLFCVSFTFLLIASTFTISISFLVCLLGFFFVSVLNFLFLESRAAYAENRTAHFSLRAYSSLALLTTLLIVLVSVPIFLAIPRTAFGFFRFNDQAGVNLSGFSDQVNLGDIGRIMTNRDVFMRVQLEGWSPMSLPRDLKWRGITLDHYSGKGWRNTRRQYQRLARESMNSGFLIPVERRKQDQENLVVQNITLEHSTKVLFGADRLVWVTGSRFPQELLLLDQNDSLSFAANVPDSFRYSVNSDVMERGQRLSRVRTGSAPASLRNRYLQLPPVGGQIWSLADQFTREQTSDLAKALVMERRLKEGFGYTLDNPSGRAEDPLSHFLLVSKAGHCEYFATAMAIMLRMVGIPSRIVNGFRAGEFNEWNGHFVVRQSDAHSWVEAWFPGSGWVEFDPTPSAAATTSFYLARLTSQVLDTIEVFWNEVLTFDRFKQIGFFVSMGSRLQAGLSSFASVVSSADDVVADFLVRLRRMPLGLPAVLLTLVGVLISAVLGWRYRKLLLILIKQNFLRKRPAQLAPGYYLELLNVLERKGFVRRRGETPHEFAERIEPLLRSSLPGQLTQLYYRARYGNLPMAPSELETIRRGLRELHSLKVITT